MSISSNITSEFAGLTTQGSHSLADFGARVVGQPQVQMVAHNTIFVPLVLLPDELFVLSDCIVELSGSASERRGSLSERCLASFFLN